MRGRWRVLFAFLVRAGVALGAAAGCGNPSAPSPFLVTNDAGSDAALDGNAPPSALTGTPDAALPGEWGGPCVDDGQCDDLLDCTHDTCDTTRGSCHFAPANTVCDDGIFCNGSERCLPGIGCRPGDVVACSDGTACTIDSCDEATHACVRSARDADGDGDPDVNCPGGGDCNDSDPNISSHAAEICGDGTDNNCNGRIDEPGCQTPSHDVCADPLDVSASGAFPLSTVAAKQDYSATCLPPKTTFRDVVVALHVPDGAPADVDVAVTTTSGDVALAAASRCGDASSEIACSPGAATADGQVSRLRLRSLAPGVYPLYVFSELPASLALTVEFSPGTIAPSNETCGTAAPLAEGQTVIAELVGATLDVTTACGTSVGDLVYDFILDAPRDVHLFANSEDAYGTPLISLRRSPCAAKDSEITCRAGQNSETFWRALPKGHYFVSVGATGPSDVSVSLKTNPPTAPPPDESCKGAPPLTANVTMNVDLAHHEDDIQIGCAAGAPDAAYALTVARDSDVLLLLGVSDKDQGSVSLTGAACPSTVPPLACGTGTTTPVRAIARSVQPGEYRVVVESNVGSPVSVAALVRPSASPTLVAFSDGCSDAEPIPANGGFFNGNTANVSDDFTASCDVGVGIGAPDQLLSLHLDAPSRVILDARGSAYAVILDVRGGTTCPGTEISEGCSAGYVSGRSFLDLDLSPGDYWVQVDGYAGASGAWQLDAFIAPT